MKHEWKKDEKQIYLPKSNPELINLPKFKFFTIEGEGNPNDDNFAEYVAVLYSLAYGVKMSPKKGIEPPGYYEYSVYPLEGVWDISDKAKKNFNGKIDKNELVFKLMIRQPNFINEDFAKKVIEITKLKKPHQLLDSVKFEEIDEGLCIQMLHVGSYDTESISFEIMENFALQEQYNRISKIHREIYLNDARKTVPEKLKTVLRFKVEKQIK